MNQITLLPTTYYSRGGGVLYSRHSPSTCIALANLISTSPSVNSQCWPNLTSSVVGLGADQCRNLGERLCCMLQSGPHSLSVHLSRPLSLSLSLSTSLLPLSTDQRPQNNVDLRSLRTTLYRGWRRTPTTHSSQPRPANTHFNKQRPNSHLQLR